MKRYEDILNLLSKKYYGIKNIFFKNNIREGLENDTCEPGKVFNGRECVKEIKSIKMFLLMPIANSIVITVISFLFAGFLFKIKSSPLALSKNGLTCSDIPMSKIFQKDPILPGGIVHETVYTDKVDKHKFNKVVFPWLSKSLYPEKIKLEGKTFSIGFIIMLPFYLTLKYSTALWYKPISFIKKMIYKQKDWGTIPEISKINKERWVKDFFTIFIATPILLFFVFPIVFLITLIISTVVSPIATWALYIIPNKGDKFRKPLKDIEGNFKKAGLGSLNILIIIGWLALFCIMGLVFSFGIFGLTIIWFLHILTGAHESKRDGLKTILKTWANIIWDYKYIWAIFAIAMWASNFSVYLKGPHNIINFVKPKERDMIPAIITGAAVMLLGLQQMKFFKFLPKTPQHRSACHPYCNPPPVSPDEAGIKKKCPPNSSKIAV
jgi:hypothetical protein